MSKFLAAVIACSLLAQPVLVSAKLQFVTTGVDACTPDKITKIKDAMVEATQLAEAAIKALGKPEVVNSQSFLDFLGKDAKPAEVSQKNYQSIITKLAEAKGELPFPTGAAPGDIVFICPPHKDQVDAGTALDSAEKCKGLFSAKARNNGNKGLVRVCPLFFGPQTFTNPPRTLSPEKLPRAAQFHRDGTQYGSCPAMTILHELQHLNVVVGQVNLLDVDAVIPDSTGTLGKSYSVAQCKALPDNKKLTNAQNPTWFAMDVFSEPCAAAAPSGSASGNNSPKTPTKPLPRRALPKVAVPKAASASPKQVGSTIAKPGLVAARSAPVAAQPKPTPQKVVHIRIQERTGRNTLTNLEGLPKEFDPKQLLKTFKKELAISGSVIEGAEGPVMQLQGDQRLKVLTFLVDHGIPKSSIKVDGIPQPSTPTSVPGSPVAAKRALLGAKPAPPAAAKPKPNPLGGGSAPSGPRLARPARISASFTKPAPTKAVANGAKVGTGSKATSTAVKPKPTGKVSAPVCKALRRADVAPITSDGDFTP